MTTKPKRSTYGFAPVPAQPTARNVETALAFLNAHRRVSDSAPVCRWCRQHWPWCATRRLVISPVQPGGTRREVLGSDGLPGRESRRGQQHARKAMLVFRRVKRGVAGPA
jgi:hypothetical protein